MNDNNNTPAPEAHPSVLESTETIVTAYATAFRDNASHALETVGHIAKLPFDHNFTKAASAELAVLDTEATARGELADHIAGEAVDEIKARVHS